MSKLLPYVNDSSFQSSKSSEVSFLAKYWKRRKKKNVHNHSLSTSHDSAIVYPNV